MRKSNICLALDYTTIHATLFSCVDTGYMILKVDFVSPALVDLEDIKQQLLNEVRCSPSQRGSPLVIAVCKQSFWWASVWYLLVNRPKLHKGKMSWWERERELCTNVSQSNMFIGG